MRLLAMMSVLASLLGLAIFVSVVDLPSLEQWMNPGEAPVQPRPREQQQSPGTDGALVAVRGMAVMLAITLAAVVALVGVAIGALLLARCRHRQRRDIVRFELLPFRTDEVSPEQLRQLLESWHQQLLSRWRKRPITGQPGIALETVMEPGPEGELIGRFLIAMPRELLPTVEGSLRACYPNCRLLVRDAPPKWPAAIVRLKKRDSFIQALRLPKEEEPAIADALLSEMAALGVPAVVQLVLTPAPAFFDGVARSKFRARERSAVARRSWDRGDPGLGSELLARELEAGLLVQHRPLFFTEIRVGAPTEDHAQAIAGVLRGATGGENRLVVRPVYWKRRVELYRDRLRRGIGNPIPNWQKGVCSSSELTGLWQLPTPALTTAAVPRSSLPRVEAPAEISRAMEHALMVDERGPVGIRPQDKTDGLGLIGGQKTGKTSVLCQTVRVDAHDRDCAMVVLMPKPGDALKALSMIPNWRTVHYLDFEAPQFGINPLLSEGDPAMVADKVVDAFRDINMEGDIRGSSDRYLRQAAQAAIGASRARAIDGPPTLWHMYRMLLPSEEAFRAHVVKAIYTDARFTDTSTFFGRDLPSDLVEARVNTASKLDAPRNKILRLMVESLDKVLRHPRQLDLAEMVRNREILVVDGKMGTFGSDNCRVMMQFILNMLYGTLQRQQQLAEQERTRVAVKVDEAHLILNESFADALATLRSAGLEVVAAWQYGEQIQDRKVRGGMMSLLRQRCMFSMGESADAREMSELAMSVYTDQIKGDPESRSRLRITPDTIFNLPNHHAVCTWISRGARAPAFIAETVQLREDPGIVAYHLEAQRERGGFVPDRLPDPLPDVETDLLRDLPVASLVAAAVTAETAADGPDLPFDPSATTIESPNVRPGEVPGDDRAAVPESYSELDLDDVRGIDWGEVEAIAKDGRHEPSQRELEILAALWQYRVLFASQITRRWWKGATRRAAQHGLTKMARAGWVRRCRFAVARGGTQQWMYVLSRDGFELARDRLGPDGAYIAPDAEWREPQLNDPRRLVRDLHANGWMLALQDLAPRAVGRWRGPREARLLPPRRRVRGEWLDLRPQDITVGGSRQLDGFEVGKLEPVSPDGAVEIRLAIPGAPMRFDLLLEVERGRGGASREAKLRRYDALITGWARLLDRYKTLKTPPVAVFVAEDEPAALNLVRLADRTVTGRLAKVGEDESQWPYPARKGIFVVCERDLHMGSLRAFQMPEAPPDMRVRLEGAGARECRPRCVQLIEPKLLRLS